MTDRRDDRAHEVRVALARRPIVDDELLEELAGRLHRVDLLERVAEPALLGLAGELGRDQEEQVDEQADEQARPIRARPHAHEHPESTERDGQQRAQSRTSRPRPDRGSRLLCRGRRRTAVTGATRPATARGRRGTSRRRSDRRLAGDSRSGSSVPRSRSPLTLSAPTTRLSSTPNEIAERTRQEDHLGRRDQVCLAFELAHDRGRRHEDREQDQQHEQPPAEPQVDELLSQDQPPRSALGDIGGRGRRRAASCRSLMPLPRVPRDRDHLNRGVAASSSSRGAAYQEDARPGSGRSR